MMRKIFLLSFIAVLLMVLMPLNNAVAQIPKIMNYQASLIDAKPVNGNVVVTFSIFDDETSGIIPLWTEVQNIDVSNGFMNTYLGKTVPLNIPFDKQYWLEIKVNDANPYPRTRLTSSPYTMHALLASKADTADIAFTVVDGAITQSKLDPGVKALPWGPAGGVLTGEYPNPQLNKDTLLDLVDDNFIRRDEALIGDLEGIAGLPKVAKIRGIPVSPTIPKIWETFIYNGDLWKPSLIKPQSLFADSAVDGDVLFYRNGGFSWEIPLPAGPAGGDLTGFYPNPTLFAIHGIPITLTPPLNNYIFYYDSLNNQLAWKNQGSGIPWITVMDVYPYNTFVGYQAGLNTTTGQNNVAIGYNAFVNNTTGSYNSTTGSYSMFSNTTSDYNTADGYYALYSNTTGTDNTAIGANSLELNTTGGQNTAVGRFALNANTIGNFNTATGYNALYNNTTGNNNAAYGDNALYSNTTANNNSAFGSQALNLNTTGANNVAIGYNSLQSNSTGNNNTANGSQALFNNTFGSGNSAYGNNALFSNTTGGNNTAVGISALRLNSSGGNNTAIGSNTLYSNTGGSFNTAAGDGALYSNTIGNGGSAYGYNSLYNTTTGFQALYGTTTGGDNTAVGYLAHANNSSGTQNVAVGSQALQNQTTISGSTALGFQALFANTGSPNTAVGYRALMGN